MKFSLESVMPQSHKKQAINLGQPAYRRFRDILKERTRPVVLWCGAGFSIPAGLPDWSGLKEKLLTDLEEKAETFDEAECARLLSRGAAIDQEENGWISFTQLKNALGQASFKEGVREHLTLSSGVLVPLQYLGFWSVGISGVVNLNLDRLATRAFTEIRSGIVSEINGTQIQSAPVLIGSRKPFILNLHGVLDEVKTWVFTSDELKNVQNNRAYDTSLSALFTNFTVIFAGVSADDVAAGGFLANLTMKGIDLGPHFWMTSRGDRHTDEWAERAGLQVIRYISTNGHDAAFEAIFNDLASFVPKESDAPAVLSELVEKTAEVADPTQLSSQSPEQIRRAITGHARHLLEGSSVPFPKKYREFVSNYARPIYNSWYTAIEEPDNIFFGYRIESKLGEGAFSHVYKAIAPDGTQSAIKIMRQEIAHDETMLSCFRRGISSMRILEKHELDGMVKITDAVELPAAIFMEYIDGPTLEQAIESGLIEPWSEGLSYLIRVTEIVQEGHRLAERVLHRDLRPSNIVLKNYYRDDLETEVVVLDFDLSWHRGAYDMSMSQHAQSALGYLAPEQTMKMPNVSTRNAAVDTHGLCATVYFVFSGKHPHQTLFYSDDFDEQFRRNCQASRRGEAKSLTNRLLRLVASGVSWKQEARPDLGEVKQELELLLLAGRKIDSIESPDFWAEELISRVRGENYYEYDPHNQLYSSRLQSGMEICFGSDFARNAVTVHISYAATGNEDRRNVTKFLEERVPGSVDVLKKAGFRVDKGSDKSWSLSYSIRGSIKTKLVRQDSSRIASVLQKAVDRLKVN